MRQKGLQSQDSKDRDWGIYDWKAASGQILTYSGFFPEQTKRIHLFGECTPKKKQVICSTLLSFGVIATFEGVEI